jgi:hypothetical protein
MPSAIARCVLPVPDRTGEDHVLGSIEPASTRQFCCLSRGHATVVGGEVEGVECFDLREASVALPLAHR